MVPSEAGPPLPPDRLQAILGDAIMRQSSLGWRLEWRSDTQAVMSTGGGVNHVAHLLAGALTCGLWIPIWLVLAISGKARRITLTVDPYGMVLLNGRPVPHGPLRGANAAAIAAVNARRELRRKAREQAEEDPVLARELRIGRPDLPRHYDDGGLVDLNHAPPAILTRIAGVTAEIAERIATVRGDIGGFSSAEELMVAADLHPDLAPEIREYGVFLR